jgi:hypothetical protein
MDKTLFFSLGSSPVVHLSSCCEETVVRQAETTETHPIVITTDAFRFILHEGVKREQGAQISDSLQANYERITRHLRVAAKKKWRNV